MKTWQIVLLTVVAVVVVFGSFFAGVVFSQTLTPDLPDEFDTLAEVWQSLDQYYVDKDALDPEELTKGAINGLIDALDDPYTSYFEDYESAWGAFEGAFEGIGAFVSMEDGELIVVSTIPGSPAEREGLRAGDRILEVNGEPTSGMSLNQAVSKIRGPEGTKVTLLIIRHEEETEAVTVEIIRERIELPTVYLEMLPDNIAYLQITSFSERTPQELTTAINDARQAGVEGIVLDLRNNPGGLLTSVVHVADEFLDGGIVLYQQDSQGRLEEWPASPGGLATDLPLVVLVNGSSASGSEVLAGALQDYGRAELIGTRTYGKGSVCLLQRLSDGSALYVTSYRWLTPEKRLIEGQGLEPDFEIAGEEAQLEFAIEHIEALIGAQTIFPN